MVGASAVWSPKAPQKTHLEVAVDGVAEACAWCVGLTLLSAGMLKLSRRSRFVTELADYELLLATFTVAVGVNLVRGRTHIACACFGRSSQRLSWRLPLRNGMLAMLAAIGTGVDALLPTCPALDGARPGRERIPSG